MDDVIPDEVVEYAKKSKADFFMAHLQAKVLIAAMRIGQKPENIDLQKIRDELTSVFETALKSINNNENLRLKLKTAHAHWITCLEHILPNDQEEDKEYEARVTRMSFDNGFIMNRLCLGI